ncbi:MAG: hypothetical protein HDS14_05165 [Bacteroides sp.]|nr:hypothetical protein [Bacteroides sp.]
MKRSLLPIIAIMLLLLAACGGGTADRVCLNRAETLMDERPDSSLQILDSIDASRLGGADRALYALLLTQARDKNYIDLAGDTIINEAVDFYSSNGDERRSAMAYYYRGRAGYDAKDYREAMVDFTQSKVLADRTGDNFRAGMACRNIAYVYYYLLCSEDELEYAKKAYVYMKKSGRKDYELDVLNDLGRAYYNTGNLVEATKIADQLEKEARGEVRVQANSKYLKALCLLDESKYAEALPLWDSRMEYQYATTLDSLRRCQTLLGLGRIEEGERFLGEISDDGSPMRRMLYMKIARFKGNQSEAFSRLLSFDGAIQAQIDEARSQKVSSALADYFEVSAMLQQAELRESRMRNVMLWALLGLLLVLMGGAICLIRFLHRKRLQRSVATLEGIVELNGRLRQDLELSELRHRQTEKRLQQSEDKLQQREARLRQSEDERKRAEEEKNLLSENILRLKRFLGNLMHIRTEVADKIIVVMNEMEGAGSKGKKRSDSDLLKQTVAGVKSLVFNKSELKELETLMNLVFDNVMARFRDQVPLKEVYYGVFMLSLLDLQCGHIASLLGLKSVNVVYTRRRDMLKKIREGVEKGTVTEQEESMYSEWITKGIWSYFA